MSALRGDNPLRAEEIWDQHPWIAAWYQGQTVNVKLAGEMSIANIKTAVVLEIFELALKGQHTILVKLLKLQPNTHPALLDWYGRKPVNMGTKEAPDMQTISVAELQQAHHIIKTMLSDHDYTDRSKVVLLRNLELLFPIMPNMHNVNTLVVNAITQYISTSAKSNK